MRFTVRQMQIVHSQHNDPEKLSTLAERLLKRGVEGNGLPPVKAAGYAGSTLTRLAR
ncbi:MAG: hypothetical protein PW792_05250 [Acidobacteriaceae bacterium]|nr:hypothetical protein [Acidobacteriaceae bacterium]